MFGKKRIHDFNQQDQIYIAIYIHVCFINFCIKKEEKGETFSASVFIYTAMMNCGIDKMVAEKVMAVFLV